MFCIVVHVSINSRISFYIFLSIHVLSLRTIVSQLDNIVYTASCVKVVLGEPQLFTFNFSYKSPLSHSYCLYCLSWANIEWIQTLNTFNEFYCIGSEYYEMYYIIATFIIILFSTSTIFWKLVVLQPWANPAMGMN